MTDNKKPLSPSMNQRTAKFLARMEKNRLSQPCKIVLNMHGKVPDTCKEYLFEGLTHILDERCIEIFEFEAAKYNNQYTQGVYEAVLNADHTYKSEHERETAALQKKQQLELEKKKQVIIDDPLFAPKTKKPAQTLQSQSETTAKKVAPTALIDKEIHKESENRIIRFGYRPKRKEHRLNYVTEIEFDYEGQHIQAKTSNISVGGIKIKLPEEISTFKPTKILVDFSELSIRHRKKLGTVEYSIAEQNDLEKQSHEVRLIRTFQDTENKEVFDKLISKLIDAYGNRYKLELEDNYLALNAEIHERIFALAVQQSFSFIEVEDNKIHPVFSSIPNLEEGSLKYQFLHQLIASITKHTLPSNIHKLGKDNPLLIESFITKHDEDFTFFSANRSILKQQKHLSLFIKAASESYCIFRIQAFFIPIKKDYFNTLNHLSDSFNDHDPTAAYHLSDEWQRVTHMVSLSIVEERYNHQSTLNPECSSLNLIQKYKMETLSTNMSSMNYRQKREEKRYLLQSKVSIHHEENTIEGTLIDFSLGGLKVKLNSALEFTEELHLQKILIDLVELQKTTKKKMDLTRLRYKIIDYEKDNKILRLKIDYSITHHKGKEFFDRYIKTRKSTLTVCYHELALEYISKMMESLSSYYITIIPCFIHRIQGGYFEIVNVGISEFKQSSAQIFYDAEHYDFSAIDLNTHIKVQLKKQLNKKGKLETPFATRLFVKGADTSSDDTSSDNNSKISMTFESDMDSSDSIKSFIQSSKTNHHLKIFKAHFLPPPPIPTHEFTQQLVLLRKHMVTKAKQLDSRLQQIVALIALEDVTTYYNS